ncbi:uncharacterized protein Tco025E_06489 [Trypanosoma conorhini]|uniref:RING-type domain-containing protein n=1 Tax=Trypanosoma conorhini TaxID=83891 RepID=A0A3R7LDG5_9TRYP|nr:uncharacterized protein Tco025E_06489 [Trypanosoma conorhini]RNF12220.1 hypothetical protein Tco025E_06489 [Trypanosoma conorhini]
MDSEEDLDALVSAQVGMPHAEAAAALHAPGSDEELDALIHEALTGASVTPDDGAKAAAVGVGKRVEESVLHAPMAGAGRAPSPDSSDADGEAVLQAVLAGCGIPAPKGLATPLPRRHEPPPARRNQLQAKGAAGDEDETIVMETLLHLASAPPELVSKRRRQGDEATPQETPNKKPPTQATVPMSSAAKDATSGNSGTTTTALAAVNGTGAISHAVSASTSYTQVPVRSPAAPGSGEGPLPLETTSLDAPDMEDEKQILTAILNAVHDRQSSVSGDLVYGEGDDDVDAVLQHAEHIAASSLREEKGHVNRILHLHEHIEMREELRKARGSVGWPTCVSARAAPVVIAVESPDVSAPALSASAAKRPMLCIGTTLGILLLFDARRKLCGMCGSIAVSSVATRGAVVSLSMSFDASTVLSGHEHGALVLWDTDTLTPLREILDEFTAPTSRLQHCYMEPLKAVLLTNCGRVKLLSFTRILSKTIYRLTHITASVQEAPFKDMDIAFVKEDGLYLVAAVSADTLLVSALECGLTSVATPISRRAQPSTTLWTQQLVQFLPVSVENGVVLCVAWGVDLETFSVAVGGKLTSLHRLTSVSLERPLHAMSPITDGCLLLLDQKDVLHLLDAGVGVIVETRVLHSVEPVGFPSGSRGMRHGAALVFTGNEAILLGRRRTFTCTLLSWQARLDALVERRRFPEALELAKAFALEVALAVVGLHGDSATRRANIHSYSFDLITSYLMDATSRHFSPQELTDCITSIIRFCAEIDAMDVFFGPAMDFLRRDAATYSLAFYCLEKCILSGVVTALPDMYVQPFFDFFTNAALPERTETAHGAGDAATSVGLQRVERALMCLESNPELLMRIAERHNLVRLAVSILSSGQHRYVAALRFALAKDYDKGVAVCFFESTMEGYALSGDAELPGGQRQAAQRQLWRHLLTVTEDFLALLRTDPERTLSATLLSLQEGGPDSPWGETLPKQRCVTQLFLLLVGLDVSSGAPHRPWELARRAWPPHSVVHQLFTGVTHLVLSGSLVLPHLQQFCEHACSHFIYEFQIAENDGERRSVQSDVAALITDPITAAVNFSFAEEELRQQRMARALAALHCARWEYGEAIDCYLDKDNNVTDPELCKDVFRVLREEMIRSLHCGDGAMAQRLRDAVMHRISRLVNVDATSLAQFVLEHLQGEHEDVMNILRRSSGTFLRYLDELVAKGDPMVSGDLKLQNTYIELLCAHDPARVYSYLHSHDSLVTYDLHLVLEAVKRHRIADAAVFLLEKTLMIDEAMEILLGAVAEKLRALRQEVLNYVVSVSRKGASPPSAPLTSPHKRDVWRTGTTAVAEGIRGGEETGEGEQQHFHGWAGEEPLQQVLRVGVDLCSKYNEDRGSPLEENWFRLLELFTRPRRLLCDRQNQHNAALRSASDTVDGFADDELAAAPAPGGSPFPLLSGPLSASGVMFLEQMIAIYTKYVSFLLTQMIKVLELSSVVCRIVEDHERERFGPFKPVIVDIMSSLSFELEVNRLCKTSIDEDIMALGTELHRGLNRGVVSLSDACYICQGGLAEVRGDEGEASVRIFACGHGYHEECAMGFEGGAACALCCQERGGERHRVALRVPPDGTRGHTRKPRPTTERSADGVGGGGANREEAQPALLRQREEEAREEAQLSRVLRRLRHTRAKLDGARGYSDLLCSFLRPGGLAAPPQELLKGPAEKKLLAPAPPFPVSLGEFAAEPLEFGTALTAGLTDEELLEIFGAQEGDDDDDDGAISLGDGVDFHLDVSH